MFGYILGWHREGNTDDGFGADATNTFENKWREETWKTQSQKASYSRDSASWREGWSWTTQSQRSKGKSWNDESYDEPFVVGSQSERNVLGLPLVGPLKLEDVKNALVFSL